MHPTGHVPSPLGSKCSLARLSFPLFFFCFFCTSFGRGPRCTFFLILSIFCLIWSLFWCNFSDFWGMSGICENDGFTIVKLGFLRVRGVPDRSFFLMFFRCCFRVLFFSCFYAFYTFLAPIGSQMGSFGIPWGHHFGLNFV